MHSILTLLMYVLVAFLYVRRTLEWLFHLEAIKIEHASYNSLSRRKFLCTWCIVSFVVTRFNREILFVYAIGSVMPSKIYSDPRSKRTEKWMKSVWDYKVLLVPSCSFSMWGDHFRMEIIYVFISKVIYITERSLIIDNDSETSNLFMSSFVLAKNSFLVTKSTSEFLIENISWKLTSCGKKKNKWKN